MADEDVSDLASRLAKAFGSGRPKPKADFGASTSSSKSRRHDPWKPRKDQHDTAYAKEYQEDYIAVDEQLKINADMDEVEQSIHYLERISTVMPKTEAITTTGNSDIEIDSLIEDYFQPLNTKTSESRSKLPIEKNKHILLSSITSYNVVLVEGATGSGKSTQFPYYLLENCIVKQRRVPNIFVTQPRRIAARSIAKRVCQEHNWDLGDIVGYQVGLERHSCERTLLTYCTPGVLLQRLIQEKSLDSYTHIMIDEVHERDEDTDLLLMLIRRLMLSHKSLFRLVIMSATMDTLKLQNYYNVKFAGENSISLSTIICTIAEPQRPTHEVSVTYLDALLQPLEIYSRELPSFDYEQPHLNNYMLEIAVKLIVEVIPNMVAKDDYAGTVLVFLPGLAEIDSLHRLLRMERNNFDIIPLHSCISVSDQNKVFLPSSQGTRKIILSTNIAESSLTVSDVGFIIDFCLTKIMMKDSATNFSCLKLAWSSKDQATQRAGRTGRCCPGHVFRLVPQKFFQQLPQHPIPQIMVSPLQLTVLKVKRLEMGNVQSLLAVVLDPPSISDIESAVLELKQIGALTGNKVDTTDGDITDLGRTISMLPVDVRFGKLIVLGDVFDVLHDTVVIAASLSTNKSVVKYIYGNEFKSFENKFLWADGSQCDLSISRRVYNEYKELCSIGRHREYVRDWCHKHNLDEYKLEEIDALVSELYFRLERANIVRQDQPNREISESMRELNLRIALCGAFYPNYFINKEIDKDYVEKTFYDHDVRDTVMFDGFPNCNSRGFASQIVDQMKDVTGQFVAYPRSQRLHLKFSNMRRKTSTGNLRLNTKPKILNFKSGIHDDVYDDVILAVRYGLDRKFFVDLRLSEVNLEKAKGKEREIGKNNDPEDYQNIEYITQIRGPINPTRLEFSSILQRCEKFSVLLEKNSINSVLLNPNYTSSDKWLLVGACVHETNNGGLIVRDSSLMPNVKGIASLMSLLFAQSYRYMHNEKMNCVSGACFSIGWDKHGNSLNPKSEASLSFDILLTEIDFDIINKCRKYIQEIIISTANVSNIGKPKSAKQEMLFELVAALLMRDRFPIPESPIDCLTQVNSTDILDPQPFYSILKPKVCRLENFYYAIDANLMFLKNIEREQLMPPIEGTFCYLCGGGYKQRLIMYKDIVHHLNDSAHLERVNQWMSTCRIHVART